MYINELCTFSSHRNPSDSSVNNDIDENIVNKLGKSTVVHKLYERKLIVKKRGENLPFYNLFHNLINKKRKVVFYVYIE